MANEAVDKPILITPRTFFVIMAAIAGGTIIAFTWVFSTFVTQAQFLQHTEAYKDHLEEVTIWQIETSRDAVDDLLWELEQRMDQAGEDTQTNRNRQRELKKRKAKYEGQITCLRTAGKHCLRTTDQA